MKTKCTFLRSFLLWVLLSALPAVVQAQLTFTTNNGAITITGYAGTAGAVTIPSATNGLPVTSIATNGFYNCTSLTRITIPNSVTSIGTNAFYDCSSLTNVTIGSGVTNIGDGPFAGCFSLLAITVATNNPAFTNVAGILFNKSQTTLVHFPANFTQGSYTIPNTVTNIGDGAFGECALSSITIPSSVISIGNGAFENCGLTSVAIPTNVISIGFYAFVDCTSLSSVTISSGVASIGFDAFADCALTGVTIPNSVTNIGYGAFADCTITVNSGNLYYSSVAGALYNKSQSTLLQCPGATTGSFTISNSVISIAAEAFLYCSLTSVTIPASVTSIGNNVFEGCYNLASITIPASVTNIGYGPFIECMNLSAITVNASNPAYTNVAGVLFNKNLTAIIQCLQPTAGSYSIPNTVTNIGNETFEGCGNLTNVTIPNSVVTIGFKAFEECGSLISIMIGNSVTSIGDQAFEDCGNLTSVTVPSNVTTVGESSFAYCASLMSVYCEGNAPTADITVFSGDNSTIVYFLPGTIGWGTTFGGAPTVLTALQVTTVALPNGTNGYRYGQQLSAFFGQPPLSWSLASGSLPSGLILETNGVISGTPTTNGTFSFSVKVTDALSETATQGLSLTLLGPPSVSIQPTTHSVTVAVGNNASLAVSVAGTGPFSYQWQLNGTNLPGDIITTVAGEGNNGTNGLGDGGAATNAWLTAPVGVAVDATGNLFIADEINQRIRRVGTNGIITTVAGDGFTSGYFGAYGGFFGDGGAATNAELNQPTGVAVDASGNLFIADSGNQRIRRVGLNGIISTVAGNGDSNAVYYGGDGGAATNAELNQPAGVAVDASGNLFIADYGNQRIRKVGANGIIITVAGNGTASYFGDGGAATNAELGSPTGVAFDGTGNLFIADYGNQRIRKVGTNGIITTVAGDGGALADLGDGGAAINAQLWNPYGIAADASGNLFIADSGDNRIRYVGTDGIIITVAGNGTASYFGDGGAAINAELGRPQGVAVDFTGNLLIADTDGQRIRKVANPVTGIPGPQLEVNDVGFGNAGMYDVVVTGLYGSVTSSVVNLIVTIFSVQYTANITAGLVPLTVQFTSPGVDSGGNAITSWNWTFGDGATSTIQNPSHIYTSAGTFQPSLVATNSLGATVSGSGPAIAAEPYSGLVVNGGFETGDFTGWTTSGTFNYCFILTVSTYVHSGIYGAELGPSGSLGYISQVLTTIAGGNYLLSFWLNSQGGTPNEFLVSWNGTKLWDQVDVGITGWTNLQFTVSATGSSTVLEFGFRNDPSFFGLDDISVAPPSTVPVALSMPRLAIGKTNFTFQLSGPAGTNYVLQSSTNLVNWTSLSTSTIPVSGSLNVTNAISNYTRQFFRVIP